MSQFETQDESHERILRENESLRGLLASAMANGGAVAGKLAAENSILKAERDKAREALAQVDDVLVVNWIPVTNGNYGKALHDLITFNIQIENDPSVSKRAAARDKALAALKNLINAAEAVLKEDRDRRWTTERAMQEDGCFVGVGRGPVNDVVRALFEHRCQSKHGDQQCRMAADHDGPHQEGAEVWDHAKAL
jgi:hypothetical protein